MGRGIFVVLMLVIVGTIGGAVFLSSWDIPAPSAPIEKTLPDEAFPK